MASAKWRNALIALGRARRGEPFESEGAERRARDNIRNNRRNARMNAVVENTDGDFIPNRENQDKRLGREDEENLGVYGDVSKIDMREKDDPKSNKTKMGL